MVDGNFLIADSRNHRVRLCSSNTCSMVAGTGSNGSGLTQLSFPSSVAVDDEGKLRDC